MVSVDKIGQGIANYLDNEFMPKLQSNSIEKVIVGTMMSLAIKKSETIVAGYKDNKLVQMLGIMDEKGDIDVDTLVAELKKNISKEGVKVEVPVLGTVTFNKDDVDKLYDYIMV